MASDPERSRWPFLAILVSERPARKGDDETEPARVRGLGYVTGGSVVTLAHVADRANLALLADGRSSRVARTVVTEPGLALMALETPTETTAALADVPPDEAVTIAIVSDYSPSVRFVDARVVQVQSDGGFSVEMSGRLAEDETASGSPVVSGRGVVGIVGPTATNNVVDVHPASAVRALVGVAAPADGWPISTATRRALEYGADIAELVGPPAAVLMGVLWTGQREQSASVSAQLVRAVGIEVEHVADAVGAPPPVSPTPRNLEELQASAVGPMLREAESIRAQSGAGRLHRRHLLVAALRQPPSVFPEGLFDALELEPPELRRALGEILAARHLDEQHVWGPLLTDRPAPFELTGGILPDLVDPTTGIPLDQDHLGLRVDVTMFATLIADVKTKMPLSIGLFGEWGSGKSHFMGLLHHEIEALAKSGDPRYHREIVQIGFNAWHYADSNLWASLGDEIFEQLAGPQSESTGERREALHAALADRLQSRQELKAATDRARAETARLTTELDDAIAARRTTARDLAAAVVQAPELSKALDPAWDRLGAKDAGEQVRLLASELEQAPEDVTDVRRAVKGTPWWLAAVAIAVVIAVIAVAIVASNALAGVGTALLAVLTIAGAIAARLRSGARLLHQVADGVRRRQDASVAKELTLLRQAETKERVLQTQLNDAIEQVGELNRELAELSPGQRLYSFVAARAESDAYRGQLGLISTIRKDFEQLILLMNEWKANPADGAKRPIDRIVLYIDDLDRCSPEQVVEVLQAVHLLLALDLFVVVVGVDPRWLLHSLRREYRAMLTTGASGGSDPRWETTPQDYLEKIFNIPFALPRMTPASFRQLVGNFAETETHEEPATPDAAPEEREAAPEPDTPAAPEPAPTPAAAEAATSDAEERSEVASVQAGATEIERRPVTDEELAMLSALAPLVETPRETKRLVNLYRMMRSTRDLSPASRFLGDDVAPGEYQAVVILLGLLSGHARLLVDVLTAPPRKGVPGGLRDRDPDQRWTDFAAGLAPRAEGDHFVNDIVGKIAEADVDEWARLAKGLEDVSSYVTIPDLRPFQVWAPRIARFSFLLSPYADESPRHDAEPVGV